MYILFPGRHHLLTQFQHDYLQTAIRSRCADTPDVDGQPLDEHEIEGVVFAVTSANHSHTRRNPLPFYLRAMALQEFGKELPVPCYIYGIDDVGQLDNFAEYTLKKIGHESDGALRLTPQNTVVLCSTPVLRMYEELGFRILPAELTDRATYAVRTDNPWTLVERIVDSEEGMSGPDLKSLVHAASRDIWLTYGLQHKVKLLFSDRMIGDDGDITASRDYNSYVRQMDEIARLKYDETAAYIQPGRIGDIGCAVGSWIKLAAQDPRLRESDFFGVEVARHLYDICLQRKHNNEFENPFVFFAQKNAVNSLAFDAGSMNTIHTSSLTHEIESYGGHAELLSFIDSRYRELRPGGVWINRDVIGPAGGDEDVYLWCSREDGRNDDFDRELSDRGQLAEYLSGLSTQGRFLRFALDYRKEEGEQVDYRRETVDGMEYIVTPLHTAAEFMSKKDYVDNWQSEMHETFCFWTLADWEAALTAAGFRLRPETRATANPWIIANRLSGRVALSRRDGDRLVPMDFPVSHALLISERVA